MLKDKNKNRLTCNLTAGLNIQSLAHSELFPLVIQSKIDYGKHSLNKSILSSFI